MSKYGYVNLAKLGTNKQSFHFELTPEKRGAPTSYGRSTNCMLNGTKGCNNLAGSSQYSELGCPNLSAYVCPKGFVGRPKDFTHVYTRVGAPTCGEYGCSGSCPTKVRMDPNYYEIKRQDLPGVF